MSASHLSLGPVRFLLQGESGQPLRYDDWAYRAFFETQPPAQAQRARVEMAVTIVAAGKALPEQTPLFESGRNWAVWPDGEGLAFYSGFAHRARARVCCRVTPALEHGMLYVDDDASDAPLRYPLDQILCWGLLGKCGGILLHAAVVVRNGQGVVLAGRSGAGKSTLSGLCAEAGWEILNDDRAILYPGPDGGGWLVAGTPWHGSGRYARQATVPLRGVFLLEKALSNRVEGLAGVHPHVALLHAAAVAWFSDAWSQAGLDALDRLTRAVPVRRFCFTPTRAAVDVLCREAVV